MDGVEHAAMLIHTGEQSRYALSDMARVSVFSSSATLSYIAVAMISNLGALRISTFTLLRLDTIVVFISRFPSSSLI
jgi:hypothetical protein